MPVDAFDTNYFLRCGYCHRGVVDDAMECGKLYGINGVFVHYFCMLFTAHSRQLGEDNEGLFGFYGSEVVEQVLLV